MDSQYVKSYFASPKTVSTWWEPTKGDKSHIFARQIAFLLEVLKQESPTSALDVACGKGRVSQALLEQGLETYSLDISQEMLDIAMQRRCITKPVLGDGEQLPFEDNSFDLVTCFDALVHFPNPEIAIKEGYRVLKPGGVYITNTSNPYDLGFIPRKIFEFLRKRKAPKSRKKGEGIFRYIPAGDIRKLLKNAGFDIEEVRKQGLISPIEVKSPSGRERYLLSEEFSRKMEPLDLILEQIPIVNDLCISVMYKSRK